MVERIFLQVSVSKREAEIKLDNTEFYEKHKNYRHIMWIRQGLDPDEMEAKFIKEKKDKEKIRKKQSKNKKIGGIQKNWQQQMNDFRV